MSSFNMGLCGLKEGHMDVCRWLKAAICHLAPRVTVPLGELVDAFSVPTMCPGHPHLNPCSSWTTPGQNLSY